MSDQLSKEFNDALKSMPDLDWYLDSMAERRALILKAQSRSDEEKKAITSRMADLLGLGKFFAESAPSATELSKAASRANLIARRKWDAFIEDSHDMLPYLAKISIRGCREIGAVVVAQDEEHARELVMAKFFSSRAQLRAMGEEVPINENDIQIRITPLDFEESFIWLGRMN